jgi:orotidine-5'-phosphate decarboxylase
MQSSSAEPEPVVGTRTSPTPIVALDVPTLDAADRLIAALPEADFFKVGLQLYTATGPRIVARLKDAGHRVFLDLKFHDIPNTVAGAVRSAAELEVDLLTIHASGGTPMIRAAVEAAHASSVRPLIFAVSVLTSLSAQDLAEAWGRAGAVPDLEVARLAALAAAAGADGLVASVNDIPTARESSAHLRFLTPGIRLSGDSAGDQSRVATPADAAAAGADYVVIGRTVTAAADPASAYARVLTELSPGPSATPAG